jgi:two-component system cell cycle sensor histidine kinase/response regulator CckA
LDEAGAGVVIDIADQGPGIRPEHLNRIFEPFFTARSGGTGLGLAVSHSIVTRHGGNIKVRSELGRGTTFTVELPASDDLPTVDQGVAASRLRFEGRALVMDDEATVLQVGRLLLARLGFSVEAAQHGEDAVRLAVRAAEEKQPFRVAVLDLTIVGGLGAAEIAQDLRRLSPTTRLVLSTGYAHDGAGPDWDALLQKPYTLADLSAAIEQALRSTTIR